MGICSSSPEASKNSEVNKELTGGMKEDSLIKKLLFLGSGGSGKSTLFKQLRSIHGKGFKDKDRVGFCDHIYSQTIGQMKTMLEFYDILRDENDEVADNVELLWREEAIQEIWRNRARLKIDFADSTAYFFDEVRRIADAQFLPSDKDILLVRHRTTGVIEQNFEIQNTTFHIFDVGGQKSERKKWIHCFEHVTAVIFVASLSCYDEVMFEDDTRNAMEDSLSLFEKIAMILFLNKRDLFAEKICTVPLSVCFADYNGSQNYDDCVQFVRDQFEGRNRDPQSKQIYSHVTCATGGPMWKR